MVSTPLGLLRRRTRTRDYGRALPVYCTRCETNTFLSVHKRRQWTSVLQIPLVPRRAEYRIGCQCCQRVVPLDKQEFRRARRVANQLSRLEEGVISQEEYIASARAFEAAVDSVDLLTTGATPIQDRVDEAIPRPRGT